MQDLSKEELRRLLHVARLDSERNWLMLLIAFRHGLRVSEVIALTKDNFDQARLTVRRLKGSKRTSQGLISRNDSLFDERSALVEYIQRLAPNQRLFPINRQRADQIIKTYGKLAGIPKEKRHMHALKHTCARLNLRGGAKIDEVRQWLGHESLASTGEYLKLTDEEATQAADRSMGV